MIEATGVQKGLMSYNDKVIESEMEFGWTLAQITILYSSVQADSNFTFYTKPGDINMKNFTFNENGLLP